MFFCKIFKGKFSISAYAFGENPEVCIEENDIIAYFSIYFFASKNTQCYKKSIFN